MERIFLEELLFKIHETVGNYLKLYRKIWEQYLSLSFSLTFFYIFI